MTGSSLNQGVAEGPLPAPSLASRRAWRDALPFQSDHDRLFDSLPCLHAVEVTAPPVPADPPAPSARIVAWNVERLKYPDPTATVLRGLAPDAVLLTEVDRGMARSGNHHTVRGLAAALGHGFVFGVEFVELGLGDARERAWHAGQDNTEGLHGAAITAPSILRRPGLIRLERSGVWFTGVHNGERRIGGRMAMVATLPVGGVEVALVSVHLESHSEPEDRATQIAALLDAVETYAEGRPVLIGGDLNTHGLSLADELDPDRKRAWAARDPGRFIDPVPHEPLFAAAAARDFTWQGFNVPGVHTKRTRPDGTPEPPFARIDWILGRGLIASDPAIVPAINPETGAAISDHEALAVTIRPAKTPSEGASSS